MRLEVDGLSVSFGTPRGEVAALKDVALAAAPGERVALAGESGCGKTVLALALLGLLPRNARVAGSARFGGLDLLNPRTAAALRGRDIAMCWSNAERFFNPVVTVGAQIEEAWTLHHPEARHQARRRALELLDRMGFRDPARVHRSYPFQLSGGMNQRAMLAMSLINSPRLLLVDEPTRGLDDLSRQRVLDCLREIAGVSMLLITHDIGLVEDLARRIYFMRAGEILESGPCPEALRHPAHPYARELVRAGA